MKKLKQLITELKSREITASGDDLQLLWQLICYPPKIPLRLHQERLLSESTTTSLSVKDEFFTGTNLSFNVFSWGSGKRKVLLTHGWGSKAADFVDLIMALRTIEDLQIIAFDAPGNGSSESDLSNLILFVEAVKSVVLHNDYPAVWIGHSLGAMANIIAAGQLYFQPELLISITPLVRLKENFEATMDSVNTPQSVQEVFMQAFEQKFKMTAASFNLNGLYRPQKQLAHWLAYDQHDQIAPYSYLNNFLSKNGSIIAKNYPEIGHDRIIKSPEFISDLTDQLTRNRKY
jgi:hypothetical protein